MNVRTIYPEYLELALAAALPVLLSALFAWLLKKTKFAQCRYWIQQLIIGLSFSALAVLATEFGIHIEGASINVRDAAPLIAGILFGGPAGIIAGVIGGLERWFAALWGAGMYTRLACSLATAIAGVIGAVLHRSAFETKRPAWWYMLAIGVGVESLHMLLIVWTHMSDLETAFQIALTCAAPMLAATGLSLMFSAMIVTYIESGRLEKESEFRYSLEVKLHRRLFRSIGLAFLATVAFSVVVEAQLAVQQSEKQLARSLDKVPQQLTEALNSGLAEYAEWIAMTVEGDPDPDGFLAQEPTGDNRIPVVYVTDPAGRILRANEPGLEGRNINADGRAGALLAADEDPYVGAYQSSFFDPYVYRIYAETELADGNHLIVGYGAEFLNRELERRANSGALSRNVGIEGTLTVLTKDGSIAQDIEVLGSFADAVVQEQAPEDKQGMGRNPEGEEVFYMYEDFTLPYGSYVAVATLPVSEAVFVSSVMSFLTVLTELMIFLILFVHLSFLMRQEVVSKIHAVNDSLARLTAGDLSEVVQVRSSSEFILLSGGINATIDTLKQYIAEAAARIDRELEFARTIQRAALPSVFPAFPNRGEFDIYASMEAAKEVGGDFYDFYLMGQNTLILVIADVSGKGIPAAMFMMRAKTMLKNYVQTGLDIAQAFQATNDALCENNEAQMFVTAWMGELDLQTGRLRYVNAGHNPMLAAQDGGPFSYVRPAAGFVLAGIEGFPYKAGELMMKPGDTLYVYTDGVTEAQNPAQELFGEDRLLESADKVRNKSVREICEAIRADVNAFAGEAEQFDDMTMLAVRVNYLEGPDGIQLQPDPGSSERVAGFLDRWLERNRVPKPEIQRIEEKTLRFWQDVIMICEGSQAELRLHRHASEVVLTFRCNGKPGRASEEAGYSREGEWSVWIMHVPL